MLTSPVVRLTWGVWVGLWRAAWDVVNSSVIVIYGCCNLALRAMLRLSQSRHYALEHAVLMSNTKTHQRLQLSCLAFGPMTLFFIVLWRWDSISIYSHLLSTAWYKKAMVMNILMEVSGQPQRRTAFWHWLGIWYWQLQEERKEPLTQNRVLLLSSCSVVSSSSNRTCLGFNSFSCFLPVRFQADSLTSMRFHSLPVKRDNNTPPVRSGF